MKTMKNRVLSGAMAGVLAMSLAVPAFAASNSTEITGTYKAVTIDVTVTPTASAFINPYGLDLEVSKDGSEITDSTPAADKVTISGQKIVTTPMSLQNKTAMDLTVGATLVGEVKEASDMRLAAAPLAADDTSKPAFVYLQAAQEPTLTGTFTATDAAAIAAKYAAWAASDYDAAKDVILGIREVTKQGLVTLAAADVGTSSFKAGSIALYRLAGDCVSTPRGDGWTAADGFTANVAFTFAPAAKYSITMAAPADFTVTGSGVTAPDSATVDVTNASEGATVTVTVVAANAADVVTITVTGADGANIDVTKDPTSSGKNNVFTFTMPAQAVAIAGTVSDT